MADEDSGDEDRPSDPFDTLDADEYRDRQGNPFENLGRERDESRSSPTDADSDPESFTYPHDQDAAESREADADTPDGRDADATGSSDPVTGGVRSDAGMPSGDLFGDVDREGESPFDSETNTFEEVEVDDVDPDEVWESLIGGRESEATGTPEEVDVSKHSYCEECEHFSPPPDVHCTHEGTEILEFLDLETVRVRNCPVVAKRRELGQE